MNFLENKFPKISYIDLGDAGEEFLGNVKKVAFKQALESSKVPTLVKKHYNDIVDQGYSINSHEQKDIFFANADRFFFLVQNIGQFTDMLATTFVLKSKDAVKLDDKELDIKYQGNLQTVERYANNMANDFRIGFWIESELDKGAHKPYSTLYPIDSKENWKTLKEPLFKICHFVRGSDITNSYSPYSNHPSDGKEFRNLAEDAIGDFKSKYLEELKKLIINPAIATPSPTLLLSEQVDNGLKSNKSLISIS